MDWFLLLFRAIDRFYGGVPQSSAVRDGSLPVHDPGNAPLLDFIAKSAKTIQRTELVVAILSWVVAAVGLLLGLILIDHWVWPLNEPARYVAWLAFVSGSLIWTVTRVIPLLGRRINPEFAAMKIESIFPEMKDGLISWLQLATRDAAISRGVLNAVGRFAFQHLRGQDAGQIVDQVAPIKLMAMLVGFVLMGSVYLAVAPKSGSATLYRILMPWAKIAPATRVQILDVSPGHATVTEGSNLRIAIQVRGWRKTDVAEIVYSTDDGQTINQAVPMRADIEGLTYIIDFGSSFGGIVQPMSYSIRAGDAETGPYSIKVQAIPLVIMDRVEYHYPKYMRMKPRVIEGDGTVEGPEGTRVVVEAHANQQPRKGRLEFDFKPNPEKPFQVSKASDVKLDERNITGEWYLELDEVKSNPSVAAYRLRFENSLGESNASPIVYPIKVLPDLAPEVDFTNGVKDNLDLPVDRTLKLALRALDPDFGLTKLSLRATLNGLNGSTKDLFSDEAGVVGQIVRDYTLDPAALKLRPGDTIEFVGSAQDNRCVGKDEHPEPNVRLTRTITVTIKDPIGNAKPNVDDKSANPNGESESEKKPAGKQTPQKKDGKQGGSKSETDSGSKPNQGQDDRKQKPNEPSGSDSAGKQPSESSSPSSDSQKGNQEDKQSPSPSGGNDSQPSNSEDSSGGKVSQSQSSQGQSSGEQQAGGQQSTGQQGGSQDSSSNSQQQSGGSQSGSSGTSSSSSSSGSSGDSASDGSSSTGQMGKPPGDTNSSQSTSPNDNSNASEEAMEKSGLPSGQSSSGATPSSSNSSNGDSGASSTDASRGKSEISPRDMHDGEAFERLQEWLEKNQPSSMKSSEGDGKSGSPEPGDSGSSTKKKSEDAADTSSSSGNKPDGAPNQNSESPTASKSASGNGDDTKPTTGATSDGKSGTLANESSLSGESSQEKSDESKPSGGGDKPSSQKKSESADDGTSSKDKSVTENAGEGKQGNGSQSAPNGDGSKSALSGQSSDGKNGGESPKSSDGDASKGSESETGSKSNSSTGESASSSGNESSGAESSGTKSEGQSSTSGAGKSPAAGTSSVSSSDGKANGSKANGDAGAEAKSSSNSSSSSKKSGNPSGSARSGSTNNSSDDAGKDIPETTEQAEAEVEYARQATDMVLKALDRQKNQPIPTCSSEWDGQRISCNHSSIDGHKLVMIRLTQTRSVSTTKPLGR